MAVSPRIQLDLPPDLYMRVQDAAARSGRPVEAVLVESLDLLFGASSIDWEQLTAKVEDLADAQLWALVYRRMPWAEVAWLRELTVRGKQGALPGDQQAELTALITDADRFTLLRSRVLLTLQERGHNVRDQLQLGA